MSSRRRLYLHIGPHKTGTTYLQKNFVLNRDVLACEGFLYPRTGQTFMFGHHNLAWHFYRNENLDFEALEKEIETARNLILSSEAFSHLNPAAIQQLQALFSDYEPRVIVFARARGPLLYSHWQESVRQGCTWPLPEAVMDHLERRTDVIDKRRLVYDYAKVFGTEAIRLVVYDNVEGDLFRFFVQHVLGLSVELSVDEKRVNAKHPPVVIEVFRGVLRLAQPETAEEVEVLRTVFFNPGPDMSPWVEMLTPHFRQLDLSGLDTKFADLDAPLCRQFQVLGKAAPDRLFGSDERITFPYLETAVLEDHRAELAKPLESLRKSLAKRKRARWFRK